MPSTTHTHTNKQIKKIHFAKDSVKRIKRQDTDWETVFINLLSGEELSLRVYVEVLNSAIKTQTIQFKMERRHKRTLPQERCSTSQPFGKCKLKPQYHLHSCQSS